MSAELVVGAYPLTIRTTVPNLAPRAHIFRDPNGLSAIAGPDQGVKIVRLICIRMLTPMARPMKARSSIMEPTRTGFSTLRSSRSGGSVME